MTADVLWRPALAGETEIERFAAWVSRTRQVEFERYEQLWQWSVDDIGRFWGALFEFLDLPHNGSATPVLTDSAMPGADWFPGLRLNYAEAMLRLPGRSDDDVVIVARSQSRADITLTAAELRDQVARARRGLQRAGVTAGDRVVAYAPNVPETLVLLLASASLGAVFSSCAPEFGVDAVVARWQQIEPVLLFAVDGYGYADKRIDRRSEVAAIRAAVPSVRTVVQLAYLDPATPASAGALTWADFTGESGPLEFDRVPFAAPLYVLFSSGTTGMPKPIVHGHGGIALEHLKALILHNDIGSADRFFWFSTTGWMMWNFLVSGIGAGATIVMFDGNPAYPDPGMLWRLAAELRVTYFGTSAPHLMQCRSSHIRPAQEGDLEALRAVGSTGAPLPASGYRWLRDELGPAVQLCSISGGTDICSAFVGAAPTVPVYAGEISCRALAADVDAFDSSARPVRDELGELVVKQPMPSMPLGFWGDDDGSRYRAAYFEDIPNVWRHGDWIRITGHGSCTIAGRSDATLNRGGVRLGTAEFYAIVESMSEIKDSMVVHVDDDENPAGHLLLFVVLAGGRSLDDVLTSRIASELRSRLSPRHVPDEVHQVRGMPRTLSGKRLEVPVKQILLGTAPDEAASAGSLQNPQFLDEFVAVRTDRTQQSTRTTNDRP